MRDASSIDVRFALGGPLLAAGGRVPRERNRPDAEAPTARSRRPASACTMNDRLIPELWEWAEYYCPWCYIAAVRLHRVAKEYEGRVTFRTRPFPLELAHGEAAPRDILQPEWRSEERRVGKDCRRQM